MKVIFLDVDGVIVPFPYTRPHGASFSEAALGELKRIVSSTGAEIVISSSWRNYGWLEQILRLTLKKARIKDPIDKTVNMGGEVPRHYEIAMWLAKHKVDRYAILDDGITARQPYATENFFQTEPMTCITTEIADKVIDHLNNEAPREIPERIA